MKAAFLIGESKIEVRDVPAPEPPPDGILLKVVTCGVCGSDLRRWKEGPYPGSDRVVPGHEVAGIIEAVGSEVKDYRQGERLAVAPDVHCGTCYYCQRGLFNLCDDLRFLGITPGYSGGFAEKMVLTRQVLENGIVHRMPQNMNYAQASFAEPCSSVLACHDKAGTSLRDTVLIMGAGPIGCLHIVIAKARGARVILSEPSEIRRNLAQGFGPDLVIDPSSEAVVELVRQFTGGLGVDIAICANPVAATQTQAVQAVRKAGRVILFGGLPKANPLSSLNANLVHYGEILVIGAFSYHPTYHQQALEVISRGLIPADRFITHTFALEHINEAFNTAAGGQALKVMVDTID